MVQKEQVIQSYYDEKQYLLDADGRHRQVWLGAQCLGLCGLEGVMKFLGLEKPSKRTQCCSWY